MLLTAFLTSPLLAEIRARQRLLRGQARTPGLKDLEKIKKELSAAGYKGERVTS